MLKYAITRSAQHEEQHDEMHDAASAGSRYSSGRHGNSVLATLSTSQPGRNMIKLSAITAPTMPPAHLSLVPCRLAQSDSALFLLPAAAASTASPAAPAGTRPLTVVGALAVVAGFGGMSSLEIFLAPMLMASKEPARALTQEFATMIVTAFGLVAALAWSDAIKAALSTDLYKAAPVLGPLLFACIVTLLAWVVSTSLGSVARKPCTELCTPPPGTAAPRTAAPRTAAPVSPRA